MVTAASISSTSRQLISSSSHISNAQTTQPSTSAGALSSIASQPEDAVGGNELLTQSNMSNETYLKISQ